MGTLGQSGVLARRAARQPVLGSPARGEGRGGEELGAVENQTLRDTLGKLP